MLHASSKLRVHLGDEPGGLVDVRLVEDVDLIPEHDQHRRIVVVVASTVW